MQCSEPFGSFTVGRVVLLLGLYVLHGQNNMNMEKGEKKKKGKQSSDPTDSFLARAAVEIVLYTSFSKKEKKEKGQNLFIYQVSSSSSSFSHTC